MLELHAFAWIPSLINAWFLYLCLDPKPAKTFTNFLMMVGRKTKTAEEFLLRQWGEGRQQH
jgi:hypothetical protein